MLDMALLVYSEENLSFRRSAFSGLLSPSFFIGATSELSFIILLQ